MENHTNHEMYAQVRDTHEALSAFIMTIVGRRNTTAAENEMLASLIAAREEIRRALAYYEAAI